MLIFRACTCKCGPDHDIQRNTLWLVPCASCVDSFLGSWVRHHLSDQASTSPQITVQLCNDDFPAVQILCVKLLKKYNVHSCDLLN